MAEYPDFERACGYGSVTGIGGANCRHSFWPFIEGASERAWTDEQLRHIDDGLGCEFEGKRYSAYEATQMQRRLENSIRRQKRRKTAFEAAGLTEDAQAANIRLRRLHEKYREFSKAAGLPQQRERLRALALDKAPAPLEAPPEGGIIAVKDQYGGGSGVQTIGKIDIEKYKAVSPNIRTSEVIITDERIAHIKERHPNDFERYSLYLEEIIKNPDYIIEDERPNTAMVLKQIESQGERFRLALRLATPSDNLSYKNSILTFLKIREKEWERLLRNKKILYKSE